MRVAQYKELALLVINFLKVVKINRIRPVGIQNQRVVYHFTLVVLGDQTEGVIHGRLDDDFLIGFDKDIHNQADARHDAWNKCKPLFFSMLAMVILYRFYYRWPPIHRITGVTIERVLQPLS